MVFFENRFATGRIPTGAMFSHGLRSKCTDLAELQPEWDSDFASTAQSVFHPG